MTKTKYYETICYKKTEGYINHFQLFAADDLFGIVFQDLNFNWIVKIVVGMYDNEHFKNKNDAMEYAEHELKVRYPEMVNFDLTIKRPRPKK